MKGLAILGGSILNLGVGITIVLSHSPLGFLNLGLGGVGLAIFRHVRRRKEINIANAN